MSIGNRIRKLRTEKKFSQEYLAQMLDVSRQAVSKWETDTAKPDTANIIMLAETLDTSAEYILTGKENDVVLMPAYKPETQKNRKKNCIMLLTVILIVVITGYVCWATNLPVDYDAGACGGGFAAHIFHKYSDELARIYMDSLDDKDMITGVCVQDDGYEVGWSEDVISVHFDVSYEHKIYGKITQRIGFFGRRYWFEKYRWNAPVVVG